MWGSLDALRYIFMDKASFIRHLKLHNGSDPEHMSVRASQGVDACSHLMLGYWVWSKIINSLTNIKYDSNSLVIFPYDWRLSFYELEKIDAFFTRLKKEIETL